MTQENKMGTMPVNRLLVTMSLPMVISMLVQAMYNIVDSIFVSMISQSCPDRRVHGVPRSEPDHRRVRRNLRGRQRPALPLTGRAQSRKTPTQRLPTAYFWRSWALWPSPCSACSVPASSLRARRTTRRSSNLGTQYLQICCIFSIGHLRGNDVRAHFTVHRADYLQHDHPGDRRHHQHHSGPHPDLRPVWIPQDGHPGSGRGHRVRTDRGHASWP